MEKYQSFQRTNPLNMYKALKSAALLEITKSVKIAPSVQIQLFLCKLIPF